MSRLRTSASTVPPSAGVGPWSRKTSRPRANGTVGRRTGVDSPHLPRIRCAARRPRAVRLRHRPAYRTGRRRPPRPLRRRPHRAGHCAGKPRGGVGTPDATRAARPSSYGRPSRLVFRCPEHHPRGSRNSTAWHPMLYVRSASSNSTPASRTRIVGELAHRELAGYGISDNRCKLAECFSGRGTLGGRLFPMAGADD